MPLKLLGGPLDPTYGGMGLNNSNRTLQIATFGGTLTFAVASINFTIPKSGTAVVGTGAADRLAFFSSANDLTTDSGLTWQNSSNKLTINRSGTNIIQIGAGAYLGGRSSFDSLLEFSAGSYYDGINWRTNTTSTSAGIISMYQGNIDFAPHSGLSANSTFTPVIRLRMLANGGLEMGEQTAPAAGAGDTCRIFVRDNGAGKTQLCAIFNTGAVQVIASQP